MIQNFMWSCRKVIDNYGSCGEINFNRTFNDLAFYWQDLFINE